jgi:hypothetical protein
MNLTKSSARLSDGKRITLNNEEAASLDLPEPALALALRRARITCRKSRISHQAAIWQKAVVEDKTVKLHELAPITCGGSSAPQGLVALSATSASSLRGEKDSAALEAVSAGEMKDQSRSLP